MSAKTGHVAVLKLRKYRNVHAWLAMGSVYSGAQLLPVPFLLAVTESSESQINNYFCSEEKGGSRVAT